MTRGSFKATIGGIEVRRYQTADGEAPVTVWLDGLRDRSGRARIVARLDRLRVGLYGDWKSVGRGFCELRMDFGPGYRVYYAKQNDVMVLLLCGGDKRTQAKDIETAHGYWKDYQARSGAQPPVQGVGPSARRGRNRRLR